jgi:hypothetical protein
MRIDKVDYLVEYHFIAPTRDEKMEKEFQIKINNEEFLVSFLPLQTRNDPNEKSLHPKQIFQDTIDTTSILSKTNIHHFISVAINGLKRIYCCFVDERQQDQIFLHSPVFGTQIVKKLPRLKVNHTN